MSSSTTSTDSPKTTFPLSQGWFYYTFSFPKEQSRDGLTPFFYYHNLHPLEINALNQHVAKNTESSLKREPAEKCVAYDYPLTIQGHLFLLTLLEEQHANKNATEQTYLLDISKSDDQNIWRQPLYASMKHTNTLIGVIASLRGQIQNQIDENVSAVRDRHRQENEALRIECSQHQLALSRHFDANQVKRTNNYERLVECRKQGFANLGVNMKDHSQCLIWVDDKKKMQIRVELRQLFAEPLKSSAKKHDLVCKYSNESVKKNWVQFFLQPILADNKDFDEFNWYLLKWLCGAYNIQLPSFMKEIEWQFDEENFNYKDIHYLTMSLKKEQEEHQEMQQKIASLVKQQRIQRQEDQRKKQAEEVDAGAEQKEATPTSNGTVIEKQE